MDVGSGIQNFGRKRACLFLEQALVDCVAALFLAHLIRVFRLNRISCSGIRVPVRQIGDYDTRSVSMISRDSVSCDTT